MDEAEALALVTSKKYKPVGIEQYGHGFLLWFETDKRINYVTLGKQFDGTGYDVVNHGHDLERRLYYFVLVEDSIYSNHVTNDS